MTTPSHVIVEIDDGGLHVVAGGAAPRGPAVHHSVRLPAADLTRESLTAALRGLDRSLLANTTGVHVVLGDRRMHHFTSTLPVMRAADVVAFVTREALRLTGMSAAGDVLVSTRLLRRLPGRKLELATTALARGVFEPLRQAFVANGIDVAGLYSTETCLALAADATHAEPDALVECSANRARFVLCSGGAPVQVRRFLVGGGDSDPAAVVAQLAMELPRTFDWLRETGQPLPRRLILGTRLHADADALALLRGDGGLDVVGDVCPVTVPAGAVTPSLGAAMLLARLCTGGGPASLLAPPRLVLPWTPVRRVATAAFALVGAAATVVAGLDVTAALTRRGELAASVADAAQLAALALPDVEAPAATPASAALQHALTMRRPVSRLVHEVSGAVPAGVSLHKLEFASTDRVLVEGIASGATRADVLAALARFAERLRALPFLVADGQDEVTAVPGDGHCLRFRLALAWRTS